MADDLEPPEDERAIELFSIAAIFPELVIHPENPFRASIEVPVSPTKPLAVVFPPQADGVPPVALPTPPSSNGIRGDGLKKEDAGTQTAPLEVVQDIRYLSHLPPLSLEIQLPEGYPSEKAPEFSLSTKTSWLPKVILEQLKDEGDKLWEERGRDQVVFDYIDYLQQAAEKGFDLGNQLDISQDIKISMLDFDSKTKREKFEKETFDCGICLGRILLCAGGTARLPTYLI